MKNGPYEMVIAPKSYPGKLYRGRYAYEHHVNYWAKFGAVPKKGEIIHHIDGDKRNNDPSNLELMLDTEHKSHHAPPREMMQAICHNCGKEFENTATRIKNRLQQNDGIIYCGRGCARKKMWNKRRKIAE